ncbi:MAG: hypothetical protein ACJ77A_03370 [Actinomycetota bacterium]
MSKKERPDDPRFWAGGPLTRDGAPVPDDWDPDWPKFRPVDDPTPLRWLADALVPGQWPYRVDWILPRGYAANARVLHPVTDEHGVPMVPWARVAAWSGRRLEPTSYFFDIATREDGTQWPGTPEDGKLGDDLLEFILETLVPATTTPGAGWFCLWPGQASFHLVWPDAPVFQVGPSGSGADAYLIPAPLRAVLGDLPGRPTWWWPEDRSWIVATEIDGFSTYVAGSTDVIGSIVADGRLESFPASPDDPWEGCHPGQTRWSGPDPD